VKATNGQKMTDVKIIGQILIDSRSKNERLSGKIGQKLGCIRR
jgi:hypothetical protein